MDFTASLLRRMRLPMHFVTSGESLSRCDGGLHALMGMEEAYEKLARAAASDIRERTVYKVLDPFLCHYIFFLLPRAEVPTAAVIGPYLTEDLSQNNILEVCESQGIPLSSLSPLSEFYASLPVYHDPSAILAAVTTLGESMWAGAPFHIADFTFDQDVSLPAAVSADTPIAQEDILLRMQQMEARYAYEDQLMEIVSKGMTDKAETIMAGVSRLNYQPRVSDPLRNQKNYLIICNTLLRKAAQQGNVHPFHLDKISDRFARAIENAPSLQACQSLMGEMVRAYCHLVRSQAAGDYSITVQRALTYIAANLSGDLSLTTLARMLGLAPSYLSGLFRKETGHTLSAHILDARLKAALQLLQNTHLQIQSIAQLCGFADPNYFSRQFKRQFSLTPLQYRMNQRRLSRPGIPQGQGGVRR